MSKTFTSISTSSLQSTPIQGVIAIFAKCPIPGSSKTRLSIIVGDEGSAELASAMLTDILLCLSNDSRLDNVMKFLVYGPGDDYGQQIMTALLSDLNLPIEMTNEEVIASTSSKQGNGNHCDADDNDSDGDEVGVHHQNQLQCPKTLDCTKWHLLPMQTPKNLNHGIDHERGEMDDTIKRNLRSSDLGSKLEDVLTRIRDILSAVGENNDNVIIDTPVVFLGMDSPELPSDEIVQAIQMAQTKYVKNNDNNGEKSQKWETADANNSKSQLYQVGKAYLNPAHDGGYGMLCVPSHAPPSIFKGIRWSSSLTAVSQLKALTDNGVDVIIGSLMNDIDEPDDLMNLAVRLCLQYSSSSSSFSGINPSPKSFDSMKIKNEKYPDRLSECSEMIDTRCTNSAEEEEENSEQNEKDDKMHSCIHTFDTLLDLGLVQKQERSTGTRYIVSLNRFQVKEL